MKMKKALVFAIILMLLASTVPSFAAEKSMFQTMSDTIKAVGEEKPKAKTTETKTTAIAFQKASNYIERSSPKVKPLSLRDNPEELARRRGIKK